jgi:hypothetical protein
MALRCPSLQESPLIKKTNRAYTAKTYLAELDVLAADFKKSHRNYRTRLYASLAHTYHLILKLQEDDRLRKRFIFAIRERSTGDKWSDQNRKKGEKKLNLTTEVVAIATGAESKSSRKLAWKRGRVLDLLREDGVKPEKIVQEIKARGGIEKIIRDAGGSSARTPTEPGRSSRPRPGADLAQETITDLCVDERSNDKKISIPIWMRLSERDELLEKAGTKFTLRVRVKDPTALELVKIKHLSQPPKTDIFSDW